MKGEADQSPVSGLCTSRACGAVHSSEARCGAGSLHGEVQTEWNSQIGSWLSESLIGRV